MGNVTSTNCLDRGLSQPPKVSPPFISPQYDVTGKCQTAKCQTAKLIPPNVAAPFSCCRFFVTQIKTDTKNRLRLKKPSRRKKRKITGCKMCTHDGVVDPIFGDTRFHQTVIFGSCSYSTAGLQLSTACKYDVHINGDSGESSCERRRSCRPSLGLCVGLPCSVRVGRCGILGGEPQMGLAWRPLSTLAWARRRRRSRRRL